MLNLSLNQIKRNETEGKIIKDIRNLFKSKGKDNAIKDKLLRDIRTLFESDEDDYYKPIRTGNAFSSNYIEYESNGDKNKSLSVKEYRNKTQGEWKIELTMEINFVSSKDSNETRTMHTKSNNNEIMIANETDEIIKKLFDSLFLLQRYQEGLEKSMEGSEFVFDSVDLLYYKCHQVSLNCGGSYLDSPK